MQNFFILSSFLLSYRLYLELEKSDQNIRQHLLIILKYLIKRIFRVYLPFVLVAAFFVAYSQHFNSIYRYNSFWKLVSLNYSEKNHLWTIAPEIRYYFIIPILIYFIYTFRVYYKNLIISMTFMIILIDYFNILPNFFRKKSIFFKASLIALIYLKIERTELYKKIQSHKFFRISIGYGIIVLLYCIIRRFSKYFQPKVTWEGDTLIAEYYNLALFVMVLIGSSNFVTDFLELEFLQNLGKFSFGIYLLHPFFINIIRYWFLKSFFKNPLSFFYIHKCTQTELLIIFFIQVYLSGISFYHLIENPLMKIALKICRKLSNLSFFQKKYEILFNFR